MELHLHTNMSAMDGMSSTASLLCRAAKVGTPRDGDHRPRCGAGVPRSAARAGEGKQKDIIGDMKIIYGIEAYYINDENSISVVRGRAPSRSMARSSCSTNHRTQSGGRNYRMLLCALWRRDSRFLQTYVSPHKPIPAEITS